MEKDIIISTENKTVKSIKELKQKKYRLLKSQYIVEGIKVIKEAILCDIDIDVVVFSQDYDKDELLLELFDIVINQGIDYLIVSSKISSQISDTKSPQGVLAIINKKEIKLEALLSKPNVRLVLLDGVQDPGNLGTIIRTADAFNIDAVVLSKGCVDLYNDKVIRSTMGSIFHLPIFVDIDLNEFCPMLSTLGFLVAATGLKASQDLLTIKGNDRVAIILGNEANGVSDGVYNIANARIHIPIKGQAESLNVAIAAAICMYELCD